MRVEPDRLNMNANRRYALKEAASLVGVSPVTLKRWFLQAKVADVARDRNGWRVFTTRDIERIRAYARKLTPPITPHN
jgi:DNA-binding transcriptional MerR regulator